MKWNFSFTLVLVVGCLRSGGQTNSPPTPVFLYSLSALPLRKLPSVADRERVDHASGDTLEEAGKELSRSTPNPDYSHANDTNAVALSNLTNQISITSSEFTPVGAAIYERLVQQGYFKPRPIDADPPFEHFVQTIFIPEVTHLGKVDLSCSILTAIQRKNPLCLINPIFFQLTW
jgi:hypothetical protein